MKPMSIPGFTAESSLGSAGSVYQGVAVFGSPFSRGGRAIPQLRYGGDPDLGEYIRCIQNGGGELVCRFFAGLPPFTIGSLSL
jgi:hypothetical protein